ncbi:hypothetical protein BDQ17DRAFT_1342584 [Cyathus striatus]|nr:hypothetical protein BDQ17DRAFT_1342584 [Cyathus striatus]
MSLSFLLCWLSTSLPLHTLVFFLSLVGFCRSESFIRVFPSFTLVMANRSESPALPDYYRSTRQEVYGPHARNQACAIAFNAMRTLGLRDSIYEYQYSDYLLPDISEEGSSGEDVELDSVIYSLKEEDFNFTHFIPARVHKRRYRRIRCLIALIMEKCRYRRRKTIVIRPASRFSINLGN